jgi:hypothetical protein
MRHDLGHLTVATLRGRLAPAARPPRGAGPPPDVRAEVELAAARAAELAEAGRELHFETDPTGGRVSVRLRELDGTVIETLTLSAALHLLCGGER